MELTQSPIDFRPNMLLVIFLRLSISSLTANFLDAPSPANSLLSFSPANLLLVKSSGNRVGFTPKQMEEMRGLAFSWEATDQSVTLVKLIDLEISIPWRVTVTLPSACGDIGYRSVLWWETLR
uniref:Uncharacterized protein n=1 Tax=Solanum lycopersicum TaxID=4081 RepID=A0A3Q7JNT7_SOLLC